VSKQVAQEILANPDMVSIGGTRKDVVTLFCDVRGFTSMSETEPAEKVVEMLNTFFGEMVPIIFKYEGTLDKYIGDAFMAVFGSPVAVENAADKAVECAIQIQNRMREMNEKWKSEGKMTFGVGVGLNFGSAISGNIGYEERMEYTVIGDSVNVAARVEKLTRKYDAGIIATQDLIERTSGKFLSRRLDRLQVKGKNEFIEIFEILAG
jgi:adenylate cyclase